MAGYMLVERKMLKPHKAEGVAPHEQEMGFLDYLRELNQEVFPFKRGTKLRVVGFEETLLAASDRQELAVDIHRRLAARANELERMGGFVQVVFEWQLSFGEELWFTRGASERISLRPVFGTAQRQQEGSNVYYVAGFNLT